jgi:nanoRNase/pAp phosphatase (c-di-AMP/oligoRNAs hydrolase)
VGVGFNPWRGEARDHDLGALCESFGGGGHAAVGGITLPPGDVVHARTVVSVLIRKLSGE